MKSDSFAEKYLKPFERPATVASIARAPRFVQVSADGSNFDAYFSGRREALPLLQLGDAVVGRPPDNRSSRFAVTSESPTSPRQSAPLPIFCLDGNAFATLIGFYDQVEQSLCPGFRMGRHLDALDDVLVGELVDDFLYRESIELVWKHAAKSQRDLGHTAMADLLTQMLQHCHSTASSGIGARLSQAQNGKGPTLFDWLVEIIGDHAHVKLTLA